MDIAVLKAVLDSSDMKRGADEGKRAIESLAGSTEKLDAAMAMAQRAGRQLLAVFGVYQFSSWIKGSVDLAARYETLGVVLSKVASSAGYTSGSVSKLTVELQKQGISMLQSRQTVISMIQAKLDLAKADELAAVAQDAAVTAGLNSSETLQRIVFGITSSQTEVLRTVGLVVDFESAYNKLAVSLNKGVNQLTLQEKALARVNAALEAAKPITGAYGAAMDTAGKQAKSMERYTEDLRVRIGQAFQPAYTASIMSMATALKFLSNNVELVLAVIGLLAAQGLVKVVSMLSTFRTSLTAGSAAAINANNANLQLAASEGLITEATIAAANAQKVELTAKLANLEATKAAIVLAREEALIKQQTAAEKIVRGASPATMAPLGGAVVAREMSKRTQDLKDASGAVTELTKQQAAVEKAIVTTTGSVTALNAATSLTARTTAGLTTVYNALGGAIGIATAALGALYLIYSQSMQKAKEEINENSEGIKKTLTELESKGRSALGQGLAFDGAPMTAYEKKLRSLTEAVNVANERILSYGVSFTESIKGAFTNGGKFLSELNTLRIGLDQGQFSAEEMLKRLDKLEAKYPEMAESVKKAKDEVALLVIKQGELNEFLKNSPAPLLATAVAFSAFAKAAKEASSAPSLGVTLLGPQLGQRGDDIKRQQANLEAMNAVLRTGNQSAIEAEQRKQSAANTTNAYIEEQIRKSEKLQSVQGKSLKQLNEMGPVKDQEIAQLRENANALYNATLKTEELSAANSRLANMTERVRAQMNTMRDFLDGFKNLTPVEQFEKSLERVIQALKDSKVVSEAAIEAFKKAAKAGFEQQTAERLTSEGIERTNQAIIKRKNIEKDWNSIIKERFDREREYARMAEAAIKNADKDIGNARYQIELMQLSTKERAAMVKIMAIQAKFKELLDQKVGPADALVKAREWVEANMELEKATKNTRNWKNELTDVLTVAGGIAAALGNKELGRAFDGAARAVQTIIQARSAENRKNSALGTAAAAGSAGATGYETGSVASGALSGVGAGFAAGGVWGAIIGGVVGIVGGLFGQSKKAKEAAEQMKFATIEFNNAVDGYVKAANGRQSQLGGSIQQELNTVGSLAQNLVKAYFPKANAEELDNVRKRIQQAAQGDKRYDYGSYYLSAAPTNEFPELNEQLKQLFLSLKKAIKKQVDDFVSSINVDYMRATGQGQAADIALVRKEWTDMQTAVADAFGAGALTASEYAEQLDKLGVIYRKRIEEINRAAAEFDTNAFTRILDATGKKTDAEDIRRNLKYEDELRIAREKGYDVTKLLAAQEAETADILKRRVEQRQDALTGLGIEKLRYTGNNRAADDMAFDLGQQQRLREALKDTTAEGVEFANVLAEVLRLQKQQREEEKAWQDAKGMSDLKSRDLRAGGLDILAGLNDSRQRRADERRAAENEFGKDSPYLEYLDRVLKKEAEFEIKGLRDGFNDAMADFEKNPLIRAQREATKQLDEARKYAGQLLDAGIITEEEYAKYVSGVVEKTKKYIDDLKFDQSVASDNFDIRTLENLYGASGKQSDNAALIYARRALAAKEALKSAEDLLEAGTITQAQFDRFKASLKDLDPALLAASAAAEAAAAAFRASFSDLQSEWSVFGTDAQGQLSGFRSIFQDFANLSREDALKLYKKVLPGQTLSQEDRDFNDRLRTYIGLLDAANQQIAGSGIGGITGGDPTTSAVASSFFESISEGSMLRMIDVETAQLNVLQRIETKIGANASGGISITIQITGSQIVAQTPQEAAEGMVPALSAALDRYQSRKIGTEKRVNGDAAI